VERNFTPLQEDEAPQPGTVFGIDAEFVALSQPDKVLQGCVSPGCACDVLAQPVHPFACQRDPRCHCPVRFPTYGCASGNYSLGRAAQIAVARADLAALLRSTCCSGTGVEARAARLGLGRVSVVRGEGRLAGTPCIDDTIRSLEPVADHLTRYSGLVRTVRSSFP
jgi:hypothetical protein